MTALTLHQAMMYLSDDERAKQGPIPYSEWKAKRRAREAAAK